MAIFNSYVDFPEAMRSKSQGTVSVDAKPVNGCPFLPSTAPQFVVQVLTHQTWLGKIKHCKEKKYLDLMENIAMLDFPKFS